MDKGPQVLENHANKKSERVKGDESFVPALKDGAAELEHLLAEPKSDRVSVDGVFWFNKENSGKGLGLDDFSYGFEYNFRTNYGVLDPYNIQGEDDLKLDILDGLLDDVDEVDDIDAANDFSTACEDILLDIEYTEKVSALDNYPTEGLCLGNSSSDSHSPGISGSSTVATGMSESSTVTVTESECKTDSLDKMVTCELPGKPKSKYGCQVPVEDKKCPSSSDMQKFNEMDSKNCPKSPDAHEFDKLDISKCPNSPDVIKFDESNKCSNSPHMHVFDDLDSDDNPLLSSILSECKKRAKSSVLGTKVKRLHKPTRRYIEEYSDLKSVHHMGGKENSTAALEKKHLKVKSHHDSVDETCSQAPATSSLRRGHVKKRAAKMEPESSDDYSASEPDDDRYASETGDEYGKKKKPRVAVDRRKHQRMWTLSEVIKLVDGISQYGVGKWTDIKRLLFTSSAYRTPVDLRDKWRNLLRSSFAQKKNRRDVEHKHDGRALPNHVISRIRELAAIHPYPRVPNCNELVDSSKLLTTTKAAHSPHERNVRRKKLT